MLKVASEFPDACRALLDEVLMTARLSTPEGRVLHPDPPRALTVIDLGFGCGDQTVYLMQGIFDKMHAIGPVAGEQHLPFIDCYIGVTLDRTQFEFARNRLDTLGMLRHSKNSPSIQIFCQDAAQPASWSEELDRATKAKEFVSSVHGNALESATYSNSNSSEKWVLALDTLYHLTPSRQPLCTHAYRELQASLMAFDLLLADDSSRFNRLLLIVVSLFADVPFSNFLTMAQYRNGLVAAGYDEKNIEFRDVSEHVFAPLAAFLSKREKELDMIGLEIGAFWAARWLFRWWGKTGAVRGVIVVARR